MDALGEQLRMLLVQSQGQMTPDCVELDKRIEYLKALKKAGRLKDE